MPKYTNDVGNYITNNVDIVQLINTKVPLKRSSSGKYTGLCPFHQEKTPSFHVSSERQLYHCFGCGESGNAINFVRKTENLSFVEAVETLASRYNIDISNFILKDNKDNLNEIKILYDILKESAKFFYDEFKSSKIARDYIKKRKINIETIVSFGIGYSPNSYSKLYDFLIQKGFKKQDIENSGVVKIDKNKNPKDLFYNRLMFPIFDERGRIVAFGGRGLEKDSIPKYFNSPQTQIFNKSRVLYGLNFARKSENSKDTVILVEGYMDVVSLYEKGIKNAVATLGTSITEEHIKMLERIFKNVYFAYDSDIAGKKATSRGLELLENTDLNVKVIDLKSYKDPDEFIQNLGKDVFLQKLESATDSVDFQISYIKSKYDISDYNSLILFLNDIYNLILKINSRVKQDIYIKKISEIPNINITKESIQEDFNKRKNNYLSKNSIYNYNTIDNGHLEYMINNYAPSSLEFKTRYQTKKQIVSQLDNIRMIEEALVNASLQKKIIYHLLKFKDLIL